LCPRQQWARKKAKRSSSKTDKITSDLNKKRKQTLQAKKDAVKAKIEAVVPRLDVVNIQNFPGTNAQLDLQLDWHRNKDSTSSIPKKKELTNKELKVKALIQAANMAIQQSKIIGQPSGSGVNIPQEEEED
jgi:vacuolar-type H+-ATPase subunit E/Vma4